MNSLDGKTAGGALDEIVYAEQTRMLYEAVPKGAIANAINACLLVVVQWTVVEHTFLLTWLALLLVVTAIRTVMAYRFRQVSDTPQTIIKWNNYFLHGVIATSILWGSSSIWLFPSDHITHQVFHAFVIAGMSAGASTSLSFQRLPILTYLFCTLPPLIIQFLFSVEAIGLAMGAMAFVFLLIIWSTSMSGYANTRQNIQLRFEASTRERALRESELKYQKIVDSAPLGIAHYDKTGRVTTYNNSFYELSGLDSENLEKLNLANSGNAAFSAAVTEAIEGGNGYFEGTMAVINPGQTHDIRIYSRGIVDADQHVTGGVMLVEDITEDKRAEKIKNEFISTMSHELRTPVTAIRGALGLLKGGVAGEIEGEASRLLDISMNNAERLLFLINDILDVERLESGQVKFDIEKLEVTSFLREVVGVAEGYASENHATLELDDCTEGAYINADKNRLMQVMYNLLSNAVKFSPEHDSVKISAGCEDGYVIIAVTDHGPGIPAEFHDKLFERFTQADSSAARNVPGTGLGLNIARELVEKQHGAIDFVTSDSGTTFTIRFPLS